MITIRSEHGHDRLHKLMNWNDYLSSIIGWMSWWVMYGMSGTYLDINVSWSEGTTELGPWLAPSREAIAPEMKVGGIPSCSPLTQIKLSNITSLEENLQCVWWCNRLQVHIHSIRVAHGLVWFDLICRIGSVQFGYFTPQPLLSDSNRTSLIVIIFLKKLINWI